jgi:type I site-specific restriction endonuclease
MGLNALHSRTTTTEGNTMKKVGEISFNRVPFHKSMAYQNAQRTVVPMLCLKCGAESRITQGKLAMFHKNGFHCAKCRKAERDEFNKNLIDLARRKGLIPPKK